MRSIYRLLSLTWLVKAFSRGPASGARYLARRSIRRGTSRGLNRLFRSAGFMGKRRRR